MRALGHAVATAAMVLFIGALATAEDKPEIKKDKIVGRWKVIEGLPKGSTVEFTKDGKLTLTVDMDGNKMTIQGTYSIEGDKLKSTLKVGDNDVDDEDTIKVLSDDKLTLITKDGKTQDFERVKK